MKQKVTLYDSLYKLKQKDSLKQKCFCRGGYCRIVHSRFRWIASKSDILLNKLQSMISQESNKSKFKYNCEQCDFKCNYEDSLKEHTSSNHEPNPTLQCNDCDEMFNSEEILNSHIEMNHNQNMFEITFFNPSLSRSKFLCQPCDKAFPDEESMNSHLELEHN